MTWQAGLGCGLALKDLGGLAVFGSARQAWLDDTGLGVT